MIDSSSQKDPGFDLYWLGVAFERIHTFDSAAADMLMIIEPVELKELQSFFDQWRREIVQEFKK